MYPCNLCFHGDENRARITMIMETTSSTDGRMTPTAVVSCRTIHVGSLPSLTAYGSPSEPQDDLDYSIEMTLREFQQFLEEGQCWYGNDTRQRDYKSQNRANISFDPCNALGAEVSLGDFLMDNHNNIDIKLHDAILSEEIQVTDNRRSAVLIITTEQQQYDSLEVQTIHTFDDLIPPNLMNASFDIHPGGGGDDDDVDATVDMNESYSEDPYNEDNNNPNDAFGGWLQNDDTIIDDCNGPLRPTIFISSFDTITEDHYLSGGPVQSMMVGGPLSSVMVASPVQSVTDGRPIQSVMFELHSSDIDDRRIKSSVVAISNITIQDDTDASSSNITTPQSTEIDQHQGLHDDDNNTISFSTINYQTQEEIRTNDLTLETTKTNRLDDHHLNPINALVQFNPTFVSFLAFQIAVLALSHYVRLTGMTTVGTATWMRN